ncbi:MAG: NADH-quinone oxidoreductase subunit C [Chloroflexota bacterium]
MKKALGTAVNDIVKTYDAEQSEFRDDVSLTVSVDNIAAVSEKLKMTHKFEVLSSHTAVDYYPSLAPRFHMVYQFTSVSKKIRLEVRVPLEGNDPIAPSIHKIYPNADWFERELWDMFGIKFESHPDLRRILMPHDWEGHPLRKDYPLGYEEVQFSFNYEEIEKRKPKPKD